MTAYPTITINTANPDPTQAINAFLWCLTRARELGFAPPTEHELAERLLGKTASIMFYTSMNGVTSLVMDDDASNALDDDDMFEFMLSVLKRRKERLRERRANEAAKPAQVDTDRNGEDAKQASCASSGSAVRKDAPEPSGEPSNTPQDTGETR